MQASILIAIQNGSTDRNFGCHDFNKDVAEVIATPFLWTNSSQNV